MVVSILDKSKHISIIGGGIFGLSAAIILSENGFQVSVIEKENDIMTKASLVNQNRIHMGYHYPRSYSTGKDSLKGLKNFKKYFSDAINDSFLKYYAISKENSKVSSDEFYTFCRKLKLPLKEEYPDSKLLNKSKIESCWLTPEPVFDYYVLKEIIKNRIRINKNITILRNAFVKNISFNKDLNTILLQNGDKITSRFVVNATYSNIPDIVKLLPNKIVKGKFELCVMPILKYNNRRFKQFGITVMDGPFCSLMPKGFNMNEYILYHVEDSVLQTYEGTRRKLWNPIIDFPEDDCIENCSEFFPILKDMEITDSWIATRIVLPNKEKNDARPTLIIGHGNNVFSVFSGKLTTSIDVGFDLLKKITKHS